MDLSELALARFEVVRFFRKPSNARDIILVTVILFAVLAIVGGAAWWAIRFFLREDFSYVHNIRIALGALERTRYFLFTIEVISLAVMAYGMATKTIGEEVDKASMPLLLQTPVSLNRLVLGKLLGLAGVLFVIHAIYLTVLMLPAPFMRRPLSTTFYELFFAWLFAASFLPGGAADGLAKLGRGGLKMMIRIAEIGRFAILALLLQTSIAPEARLEGVNIWDVLVSYWKSHVLLLPGEHLGIDAIPPTEFLSIVLGWQILSALLLWALFIRGRVR
jgi:ABC-type Na+ efflux pump permease subunit